MAILDTPAPNTPAAFWNTVLRYGGICGGAFVVLSLVLYLLDFNPMSFGGMAIQFLSSLAIAVGLAAAAIKHQRSNLDGGFITFGRAFLIGLLTVAIGVFLSTIWNYLFINFIDPAYIDNLKEKFVETWGESMPAEALEQSLERFDKSGELTANLTNGLIAAGLIGALSGLIAAAIMKRERPVV